MNLMNLQGFPGCGYRLASVSMPKLADYQAGKTPEYSWHHYHHCPVNLVFVTSDPYLPGRYLSLALPLHSALVSDPWYYYRMQISLGSGSFDHCLSTIGYWVS